MLRKLGQLESSALALAQMRNLRTMRVGDLASGLRLSAKQERELLSRMSRSGMIANVRKGLYLFPPRLPLGGIWTPDEATAINALMADRNARYQITGPKAFNRYGYSEQLPSLTTIYNDAISGERRVGSIVMKLIKVARDRLGGVETTRTPSGETLVYSSRARTLVDAVYDWSQFDSLVPPRGASHRRALRSWTRGAPRRSCEDRRPNPSPRPAGAKPWCSRRNPCRRGRERS